MNIESFCRQLAVGLSSVPQEKRAEMTACEIALFFEVQEHEIGLFQINPISHMAVLRAPLSIGNPATIPIQSIASSQLVSTVREQRGSIDNNFSRTPHLHMVERTLAEREQRVPVQKIMSAPIAAEGEVRWVIQVTRKGKTRDEAGADFTEGDLRHLENMAKAVAGLL